MIRVCLVGASVVWLAALLHAQAPAERPSPPGPAPLAPAQVPAVGRIDFASQIQPILAEFCEDCHDGETRKGGLSLATYADLLEGGRSGAIVRPGASARSLLVERLTGAVEPLMPKDEDALDAGRLALIRAWIDEGARATPTSPPAPQPWDAPITLTRPDLPAPVWPSWSHPVDRGVAAYLTRAPGTAGSGPQPVDTRTPPPVVSDALFARRAHLDIWGLLPEPEALQAFLADSAPDKRARLVDTLLADREKYAEHWMSFWNDLLRNEDGVNYFSEKGGRKSITPWLLDALRDDRPYDEFVSALLNPSRRDDPAGFLIGVNWRGETSAAVTPWMQASQNTAQVFLGVNMKCNACHDSFVNRWKLKDAYGLAAFFSPEPTLRLYRCDVARDEYTGPQFPFPELQLSPRSHKLDDRRAAAAQLFTDPRNGRMPRTLVNRIWERLLGRGIVATSDEMDTRPWSPQVLDWLASDFVEHGYDVQHLIATIMTSQAYQMPAVPRSAEPSAKNYAFEGPEVRRLTAEQFADAIGSMTGEWSTWPGPAAARRAPPGTANRTRIDSDPRSVGVYAREWRAASNTLTRALGRPVRDQVISVRPDDATTPQALELVNGERLTQWLERGARRLTGDLAPDTYSRYTAGISGRAPKARGFDLDVSTSTSLWLIVEDTGSNVPELVQPVWVDAVLVDARGTETRLSSLTPSEGRVESGPRTDSAGQAADAGAGPRIHLASMGQTAGDGRVGTTGPAQGVTGPQGDTIHVKAPSVLRYDFGGRRFVRFRGLVDVANSRAEIGSTLNPAVRFFIFDAEPDLSRLLPPGGQRPVSPPALAPSATAMVDRIFWQALGRPPSAAERTMAEQAVIDPARPGRLSPPGVADLLWAVLMKPEFQLIY